MEELLRPTAEDTKRRWKKLEEDLANKLAGWLTVASGSKSDKGDAKSYLFLGECKYRWCWDERLTWYIPLDLQWLEAIYRHAQDRKKVPILALEWGDGSRACLIPHEVYVEYINSPIEPVYELSTRNPTIPVKFAYQTTLFDFGSIEIPQYQWVMFPWSELSWLRIEELKERDVLGKETESKMRLGNRLQTSKLSGRWPKRGFRR